MLAFPGTNPHFPLVPASSGTPLLSPRSREHPIEVAARIELVRIAYAELGSGTLASTAAMLAFSIVMATRFLSPMLVYWSLVMLGIAGYRFWLAGRFRRASPGPEDCATWGLRLIGATTATGLGWGITAWIFPTLIEGGPCFRW